MVRIENWSVVSNCDSYTPPEWKSVSLNGNAYGHPCHKDGTRVITSAIVSSVGRIVRTFSGSEYELGTPAESYVKFCEKIGKPLD